MRLALSAVAVVAASNGALAALCDAERDCGAVADNRTDVAEALSRCAARCAPRGGGGGTITFRANASWLVSSVDLSNTEGLTLSLGEGSGLYASSDPSAYPITPFFPWDGNTTCFRAVIYARNVSNFTIEGPTSAVIDGLGWPWWANYSAGLYPKSLKRPKLIEILDGDGVTLQGLTIRNSPFWTIHPTFCSNVVVRGLTVLAPHQVGNTDGIDPDSCSNVLIESCLVSVGDDGISVKTGYHDVTGQLVPSVNVLVRNTTILSRNFAIGSACFGGIFNVTVTNCTIGDDKGSSPWAVKIKSHVPYGGIVANITFSDVRFGAIAPNSWQQPNGGMAISMYEDYGDELSHPVLRNAHLRGLPRPPATLISDVTFRSVRGYSAVYAAQLAGSTVSNLTRLVFDDVDFGPVSSRDPWQCSAINDTIVHGVVRPAPPASCGV